MKLNRNLSQELQLPRGESGKESVTTMCQLKMRLNCCKGRGFQLRTEGPLTRAEICACVMSCGSCQGQARFFSDGISKPCQTPSPRKVAAAINQAGVPSRYGFARLSQFSNFSGNGRQVIHAVDAWVKTYRPRQSKGILIEGPVGVGKTYILCALVMELVARGISVKFIDFFQLLASLKAGYSSNKADDSLLRPLIDVDVLVVDELGKGRNSDWELSILDQLVMGRYNQNKVILASTNYAVRPTKKTYADINKDLEFSDKNFKENFQQGLEERVGQRIYSRLMETCDLIKMAGVDFRRQFVRDGLEEGATDRSPSFTI